MNELIEKLKNNEAHKIFADMTQEERNCLIEVSHGNCEYLTEDNLKNLIWKSLGLGSKRFYPLGIYRIKPDYQSEPEYDDKEIIKGISHISGCPFECLGYYYKDDIFIPINFLPNLPKFKCFWYKPNIGINSIEFKDAGNIATLIEENKQTVYARMKRGNAQKADN